MYASEGARFHTWLGTSKATEGVSLGHKLTYQNSHLASTPTLLATMALWWPNSTCLEINALLFEEISSQPVSPIKNSSMAVIISRYGDINRFLQPSREAQSGREGKP